MSTMLSTANVAARDNTVRFKIDYNAQIFEYMAVRFISPSVVTIILNFIALSRTISLKLIFMFVDLFGAAR